MRNCYALLPFQITDSAGHTLYYKEDASKGKFAFTTEDYDMFEVCFESKSQMGELCQLFTVISKCWDEWSNVRTIMYVWQVHKSIKWFYDWD